MKITVTRRGGFAGIDQVLGSADTVQLSEPAAAAVARALATLAGYEQTEEPAGADRYRYEIEIQEPEGPARVLAIYDQGDPERPEMKALADLTGLLA